MPNNRSKPINGRIALHGIGTSKIGGSNKSTLIKPLQRRLSETSPLSILPHDIPEQERRSIEPGMVAKSNRNDNQMVATLNSPQSSRRLHQLQASKGINPLNKPLLSAMFSPSEISSIAAPSPSTVVNNRLSASEAIHNVMINKIANQHFIKSGTPNIISPNSEVTNITNNKSSVTTNSSIVNNSHTPLTSNPQIPSNSIPASTYPVTVKGPTKFTSFKH